MRIVKLEASGAQTHGIAGLEDSLGVSVRVDHDAIKVKRDHAAIERVEDQLSELRRPGPIAGGFGESKFRSREGAIPVGTVPSVAPSWEVGAPMAVPPKGDPRGVVFLRHFGLGALGVASLRLLVVSDHKFPDFRTPCIRRYLPNGTCLARRATAPQMGRGTITLLALALTHTGALQTGNDMQLTRRDVLEAGLLAAATTAGTFWVDDAAAAPEPAKYREVFSELDRYVEQYMRDMNSPGMTLVLADREGVQRVATYGFSDLERQRKVHT